MSKDNPMLLITNGNHARLYDKNELIATIEPVDEENGPLRSTLTNEKMSWYWLDFNSAINGLHEAITVLYGKGIVYEVRDVEGLINTIKSYGDRTSNTVIDDAITTFETLVYRLIDDYTVVSNGECIEFNHKTDNLNWTSIVVGTDGLVEIDVFKDGKLYVKTYRVKDLANQDLLN